MAATTMQSTSLLVHKLQRDFTQFKFKETDSFFWSPKANTINYSVSSNNPAHLLHEVAHALLGHNQFLHDIDILRIEREAWTYAQEVIAPRYNVIIQSDQIEDALDSYRDWLHLRSTCPYCNATGMQVKKNIYYCVSCTKRWQVNDARSCRLRRYKI